MAISRRTVLRQLSAGATAVVGIPSLARAGSVERALGGAAEALESGAPVRLHQNENPFGPSPRALAAIRDSTARIAGRYPDGTHASLRTALASLHNVDADQVVLGAGSEE